MFQNEHIPNRKYLESLDPVNMERRFSEDEMRSIGLVALKPHYGVSTGAELLHVIDDLLIDIPGVEILCLVSIDLSQQENRALGERIWRNAYAFFQDVEQRIAGQRLLNSSIQENQHMTHSVFIGHRELPEEQLVQQLERFKDEYRARMRSEDDLKPDELKDFEQIAKMSDEEYTEYSKRALANRVHTARQGEVIETARLLDTENKSFSLASALKRILRE